LRFGYRPALNICLIPLDSAVIAELDSHKDEIAQLRSGLAEALSRTHAEESLPASGYEGLAMTISSQASCLAVRNWKTLTCGEYLNSAPSFHYSSSEETAALEARVTELTAQLASKQIELEQSSA